MNMLDHQKTVLEHVIGNKELFIKELKKSVCWLEANEIRNLYFWLKEKFGSSHADIINSVFEKHVTVDFNLG